VLLISVIGNHSCKKETVPISNFCSNDTISFSSLYGITGSLTLNGEPFTFNPETDYLKPTADPDWFSVVIRQNKGCFDRYTFYIDLINTNDSTRMSDPHPRGRSFLALRKSYEDVQQCQFYSIREDQGKAYMKKIDDYNFDVFIDARMVHGNVSPCVVYGIKADTLVIKADIHIGPK
jgi:hypothetical protein